MTRYHSEPLENCTDCEPNILHVAWAAFQAPVPIAAIRWHRLYAGWHGDIMEALYFTNDLSRHAGHHDQVAKYGYTPLTYGEAWRHLSGGMTLTALARLFGRKLTNMRRLVAHYGWRWKVTRGNIGQYTGIELTHGPCCRCKNVLRVSKLNGHAFLCDACLEWLRSEWRRGLLGTTPEERKRRDKIAAA